MQQLTNIGTTIILELFKLDWIYSTSQRKTQVAWQLVNSFYVKVTMVTIML